MTDEEIVQITRTKDKQFYAQLIKRYEAKLLRYANYLIKDDAKAADIVQNAFIKAFINLNSFNTSKKFSSWIYRIVHNEAMNSIKKYKKEMPMFETIDFESGEDIEEDFTREETAKMVRSCMSKMPLDYKEPLTLFSLEGKTYSEISDILKLPINTVGTRISRAKILMRKICLRK